MVITKLIGGLGNQMFQYAAGRSLAVMNSCQLKLDIMDFSDYKLHNGYELHLYNIDASIAAEEDIAQLNKNWPRLIHRIFKKIGISEPSCFLEKSFAFDDNFFDTECPVYLDGYWQSYKYFQPIETTIREELTPRKPLSELSLQVAEQIAQSNAVSLHVRRGDYVNNPTTNKVHGFLGISYYQKCIQIIRDKVTDPHFFVFSDDIPWARENLGLSTNVSFVEHNHGLNSYEDMRLMSLCQHHIIANSSFSWWGAWLGASTDNIVLYPDKWFASNERDTSTLCPPQWLCVAVN